MNFSPLNPKFPLQTQQKAKALVVCSLGQGVSWDLATASLRNVSKRVVFLGAGSDRFGLA